MPCLDFVRITAFDAMKTELLEYQNTVDKEAEGGNGLDLEKLFLNAMLT